MLDQLFCPGLSHLLYAVEYLLCQGSSPIVPPNPQCQQLVEFFPAQGYHRRIHGTKRSMSSSGETQGNQRLDPSQHLESFRTMKETLSAQRVLGPFRVAHRVGYRQIHKPLPSNTHQLFEWHWSLPLDSIFPCPGVSVHRVPRPTQSTKTGYIQFHEYCRNPT